MTVAEPAELATFLRALEQPPSAALATARPASEEGETGPESGDEGRSDRFSELLLVGDEPRPERFTELLLAGELAEQALTGRYRWARGLGWLAWNGRQWQECADELVVETARQWTLRRMADAAVQVRRGDANGSLISLWLTLGKRASALRAIVGLARGIDGVITDAAAFDAHPDLLNTQAGVVDLRTGKLQPHDPDLLLTRITAVGYVAGAAHADWSAALAAIPSDARPYLQLRLGQALTGYTPDDDALLVQEGPGANGKSTLMSAVTGAAGDYAVHVSQRVLLGSPSDHPTELLDLRGARLALIEELPEAGKLDVARLKLLVGTPKITARRIRRDPVTFTTTHALIVCTNYRPAVAEADHGTWRRLLLARFPYRFRRPHEPLEQPNDRHGDPGLRQRLTDDTHAQQAVLSWLVDGARAWYSLGRVMTEPPSRITDDTRAWRREADRILAYVDDVVDADPDAHVMAAELLDDFNDHQRAHGHHPWSAQTFAARLADHDALGGKVTKKKTRAGDGLSRRPARTPWPVAAATTPAAYWAFHGIRFRTADDSPANPPPPANPGPVPGVPSANGDPHAGAYQPVNDFARNSWNTQQLNAATQVVR